MLKDPLVTVKLRFPEPSMLPLADPPIRPPLLSVKSAPEMGR
jgi:hypothetical protein